MKKAGCMVKIGRLLSLLAGCVVLGCTSGPQPPKGTWPWEYGDKTGYYQPGDHVSVSGNVAHFGEVPQAVKPIASVAPDTRIPAASAPAEASGAASHPAVLPAHGRPGADTVENRLKKEYDFSASSTPNQPPSYLPVGAGLTTYDVTAHNRGFAPVSVAVGIDPLASRNLSTDKVLPHVAIVPPDTDQVLVRITPKKRNEPYTVSYGYSWSMGDYTAAHRCPEHYRFPFGDNIRAYANVCDVDNSSPYTRHAVIFSVPPGTPLLAARKGRVIQIKGDNRIDILHEDSTIATYSHLGRIAHGIAVGKSVSTDDIIGFAASAGDQKYPYLQLAVWRPEPAPQSDAPGRGFELVSFPLEFCSPDTNACGVLTHGQEVSRSRMTGVQNREKRKAQPVKRKRG